MPNEIPIHHPTEHLDVEPTNWRDLCDCGSGDAQWHNLGCMSGEARVRAAHNLLELEALLTLMDMIGRKHGRY